MSNSPLVTYKKISPNSNNPRNAGIKKITIHHMAGNLSVETCGSVFASPSRQASSNYGIGTDGRVGMYVEEKNRSWCSSSPSNDHQAITIEVANDQIGGNWHVSDTALNKLIELCVDICKRNGIEKLNYTGDATGNLTRHNMFAATSCPGPYLQSRYPYIAAEVNRKLAANKQPSATVGKGDLVKIAAGATYYNGRSIPGWVKRQNWIVEDISGDRALIDKNEAGTNSINSPVNIKFLTVVDGGSAAELAGPAFTSYHVKVTASALNIRKGAGTNYAVTGTIRDKGIYTIVKESNGWGKLKSGEGWISLSYTKKIG